MGGFFFATIILALLLLIAFAPIVTVLFIHADLNKKHLSFGLYGYGVFKFVGGYISSYPGGIAVHLSETKAVVLPYSKMDSERKKYAFLKECKLKSCSMTTETGAEYMLQATCVHTLINVLFHLSGGREFASQIWLTDGDVLKFSGSITVQWNVFLLLKVFFKMIKEKIKQYVGRKS